MGAALAGIPAILFFAGVIGLVVTFNVSDWDSVS